MNVLKTGLLLSVLTVLLVFIGRLVGGPQGAMGAFVFALLINLVSYWFSDKIVLAMYRAKPLSEAEAPQVFRAVREIASRSHIPMPKLYGIPTRTPNAFATGRSPKHAAVAVTSGLLEVMSEEELKGVLAHELSHVQNRDTLVMSIAAAVAGAISMLASWARWGLMFGGGGNRDRRSGNAAVQLAALLIIAILAPIAAMLIQLAISRTREYGADETGARLTGNPHGLAGALEKLEAAVRAHPLPDANPATAHLFIVNPLRADAIAKLFSTHPPVEERVRRLRSMRL
ncbi:MAG: zinc metalloprotease HtpX [Candidatus Omnitrophica bacterium]|nr:zinc metalloprotease HtpX [Candidatus Omnitrophota bacterium]